MVPETDLGTYGTEPRIDNSSNNRAWARQDELDWQETQMQRSFTGGEAVGMPDVPKMKSRQEVQLTVLILAS